jgi:putative redox protein
MKSVVNVKWAGKMSFETDLYGHKLVMDATPESGGEDRGTRPKPLQLAALGGCSGMDVVSLLEKMRVEIEAFEMIIEAEMAEEHPKYYTQIHVIYQFKGKDLPMDKLEKVVSMSENKYCGVAALYKKAIPVTTSIRVIE